MDEFIRVDQRTTQSVHETDRYSVDLLAKIYQRLERTNTVTATPQVSVQTSGEVAANSVPLQEA